VKLARAAAYWAGVLMLAIAAHVAFLILFLICAAASAIVRGCKYLMDRLGVR